MAERLRIDGSFGEGGGQIIRTAIALSALTGVPCEVYNVRAGRSKPGLQPQHVTAVQAVAALCAAEVRGGVHGSQHFMFAPTAPVRPGDYRFDIGTAGSASLVAQTLLTPLSHTGEESSLTIIGGTHVPHAPPTDYLEHVYLPVLRTVGLDAACRCERAGFYPSGGGMLHLEVSGRAPSHALVLQSGPAPVPSAWVTVGGLPQHVGDRARLRLAERLSSPRGRPLIQIHSRATRSPGAAVVIAGAGGSRWGAGTALGARGKPMEAVVDEAVAQYRAWESGAAACDEHLTDQLVLPLALVERESRWTAPRVTPHLRSVLWLTEQFLPITYALTEQGPELVEVRLVGCRRSSWEDAGRLVSN